MSILDRVDTVIDATFGEAQPLYEDGCFVSVTRFANGAAEAYASTTFRRNPLHHVWYPCGKTRYRRTKKEGAERKQVDIDRSVRRAKKTVRHSMLALSCDHMLTFTYRENMQDMERGKADWERFVQLVRVKKKNWVYVVVPELQERGAVHFHAAVKGRQDIRYLLKCWYAVVGEAQGAVHIRGPRKRWTEDGGEEWRSNKLAGYLTKYLVKAFANGEAWAKRYWSSKLTDEIRPIKQVFWLQAFDGAHLISQVYEIVAGSRAFGVVQHLLPGDETRYWLSVPPLP